jgi:hypothetical protein
VGSNFTHLDAELVLRKRMLGLYTKLTYKPL